MALDPELIEQLWQIHNSDARRQALLMNAYGFDSTRSWVSPDGYRLSDRIWRARKAVRDDIDQVLRKALANGTDALEVATILEQYLNPDHAPVRDVFGRLIRNQKKSIVTRAPGRGGMGSFPARRLARTEITRAHGIATIEAAKRTPFATGVKWNLSGRHPKSDPCDENARRDEYKLGPGVYPPEKVPRYPEHPMCLCTLSTATENDVDGVVEQLREQYGLWAAETPAVEPAAIAAQPTLETPAATAPRTVLRKENQIRRDRLESGHVYDENGRFLFSTQGTEKSVTYTREQIARMRDTILTHNHPNAIYGETGGGLGLSEGDIRFAVHADLAQIRAVAGDQTFVLLRPVQGWGAIEDEVARVYQEITNDVVNEYRALARSGQLTREQAALRIHTDINQRIAARFGWQFTVEAP